MARREINENDEPINIAKLREEVEILELQIRKIEGGIKLRQLRQERPERKAERVARKGNRDARKGKRDTAE